ncbi:MAG: DEAD/DEAH box helicase family protein [Chloroflexi bacterium]|nr:DEAD/DEAH box helicase family protein [Chloroflexota bacterium]
MNKYNVSAQLLGRLLSTKQTKEANSLIRKFGNKSPTRVDVAKRLVRRTGPGLFCGSSKCVKELRSKLLSNLPDKEVIRLFRRYKTQSNITSPSYMRKPLSELKWVARGPWPIDFVETLSFPKIFAGIRPTAVLPTIDDVPPLGIPPKLVEFQEYLKKRMLDVLAKDGDKMRCVVTLPTGGGKTRVAVEAFIDWMHQRFAARQYLLWIAQSEELCEQAISCIRQLWGAREYTSSLRVYRYFGGRDIPVNELQGGAVVTSIQQLYNRSKSGDAALDIILKSTGAMIIDEAHRAVSHMYDTLLTQAEKVCGSDLFPICGLTAAPGRAGLYSAEETIKLVNRFDAYLVKPALGEEFAKDPLRYFRENQYLAWPRHIVYRSGREYELTEEEIQQMELEGDLPSGFLKRLANDRKRNELIIRRMLQLPKDTPTLVYACTVEHAYFLADLLTELSGQHAGAISSETPLTIRRGFIRDFKQGNMQFLCNFGVLTTGFDAPKTECIAICRPTTSEVLYEQIVGRGLRGPKFGGTDECLVIDFADNIHRLGPPLAYERFKDFWTEESVEQS